MTAVLGGISQGGCPWGVLSAPYGPINLHETKCPTSGVTPRKDGGGFRPVDLEIFAATPALSDPVYLVCKRPSIGSQGA